LVDVFVGMFMPVILQKYHVVFDFPSGYCVVGIIANKVH